MKCVNFVYARFSVAGEIIWKLKKHHTYSPKTQPVSLQRAPQAPGGKGAHSP